MAPAGRAWGVPPPVGEVARLEGLLAPAGRYDEPFVEALELHGALDTHWLAHTRLCYGERLRRDGRRDEAVAQLTPALRTFERLDAVPWAEWVRDELAAAGVAPARAVRRFEALTPQELSVAATIAQGHSNREAAARLYVSPKTVEKHLTSAYRKLGVHSRTQLIARLAEHPELLDGIAVDQRTQSAARSSM